MTFIPSQTIDPLAAAKAATDRLFSFKEDFPDSIHIYTDASSQQDGSTGWAFIVIPNHGPDLPPYSLGRLPDFTPITLAELHGLYQALTWAQRQTFHDTVIFIHTDSLSAINIISADNNTTYPEITNNILHITEELHQRRIFITFHWVPSHVDLPGNVGADKLALLATKLDDLGYAEQTAAQYAHLIKSHTRDLFQQRIPITSTPEWYRFTTVPGLNIQQNRFMDIQLRRLRFQLYSKKFGTPPTTAICNQCQQPYGPIHYLLLCPAQPTLRYKLKDLLSPQQLQLTDRHQAAILLRRATIQPDTLRPLASREPYSYQG